MGDPGDKMYFSIRGRLGIYLSKEVHGDPVAIIPEYSTVGDRALKHEEDRRSATVICLDLGTTHCLSLSKENYQKLVFVGINYFFIFIFILYHLEITSYCKRIQICIFGQKY